MTPSIESEVKWVLTVFGLSVVMAAALKTVAPLYPLPPHFGVIATLVVSPTLVMAVILWILSQSDSQSPAP